MKMLTDAEIDVANCSLCERWMTPLQLQTLGVLCAQAKLANASAAQNASPRTLTAEEMREACAMECRKYADRLRFVKGGQSIGIAMKAAEDLEYAIRALPLSAKE